jgi:Ca2+-binding EF-hand superfamily protein
MQIWDRQKHIPAQGAKPPLERIFDAFDADGDGELTPSEIAAALRSRGVDITEEVALKFVQGDDLIDLRFVLPVTECCLQALCN